MRRVLLLLLALWSSHALAETVLSHGRFESVHVYAPTRVANQFAMVLTSPTNPQNAQLVATLNARGALVAVIDADALFANLERDDDECVSPDGDLENLSHFVQAAQRLNAYHAPLLIGVGRAASFVYAMLAQAPKETFAGGVVFDFNPALALRKPLCEDHELDYAPRTNGAATLVPAKVERPWYVIDVPAQNAAAARDFIAKSEATLYTSTPQAPRDQLFDRVYGDIEQSIESSDLPPPPQVADLPLIEVPAEKPGDAFAILLSGDGGWAGLDKDVATAIAEHGIPVVGIDSLRYFWSERTPQALARDLERIVRTYVRHWHRERVVLIGYSQGADVLPFALNQFDADTLRALRATVMIGLAERAQFEFHVGNWLGIDGDDASLPIEPEMHKLRGIPVICIYGEDDDDARCDNYKSARIRVIKLPGGHHFDGDYETLAKTIVGAVK